MSDKFGDRAINQPCRNVIINGENGNVGELIVDFWEIGARPGLSAQLPFCVHSQSDISLQVGNRCSLIFLLEDVAVLLLLRFCYNSQMRVYVPG